MTFPVYRDYYQMSFGGCKQEKNDFGFGTLVALLVVSESGKPTRGCML